MVKKACVNVLLMSTYSLVLQVLLPIDIFPDWSFMLQITAVSIFGYIIGIFLLVAAAWLMNTDVLTQRCMEWTTVQIFCVSCGTCYLVYGLSHLDNVFRMSFYFASTLYLHCPYTWLWIPAMKRLAAAKQHTTNDVSPESRGKRRRDLSPTRGTLCIYDGTASKLSAAVASTIALLPLQQNRHYDADFWGCVWTIDRSNTIKNAEEHATTRVCAVKSLKTDDEEKEDAPKTEVEDNAKAVADQKVETDLVLTKKRRRRSVRE